MTLAFTTEINGKPTNFVKKILKSLLVDLNMTITDKRYQLHIFDYTRFESKIHTIREDKSNRWKAGNKIHFVINNRTKNRFQFAPVLLVKSIQKIKIEWIEKNNYGLFNSRGVKVFIDNVNVVNYDNIIDGLVKNDGFENRVEFFEYFSEDFEGKIIHWTDFKYKIEE